MEEIDIVIVGGGICGLATALALHRKGFKSVVLERSEELRAGGAGITIRPNGWRALDELGVASKLRQTTLPLEGTQNICLSSGKQRKMPLGGGETRCLRRVDLITTLAESLPPGTVRFGSQALSIHVDSLTSYPILQLQNGSTIKAKVLIGCDGINSVVADFLELNPPKIFSLSETRGLAVYPSGHNFGPESTLFNYKVDNKSLNIGRIPVNDKLVYWFIIQKINDREWKSSEDSELIRQSILNSMKECPFEISDMVRKSNPETVSHTRLRYHSPWDILVRNFHKGSVTVAGDAMHSMASFLGQGGSTSIEDAIVITRCLAQKFGEIDQIPRPVPMNMTMRKVGEALDEYVKERRMRLVQLSTQTFLIGLLEQNSYLLVKFVCIIVMTIFFSDFAAHTRYDCGRL